MAADANELRDIGGYLARLRARSPIRVTGRRPANELTDSEGNPLTVQEYLHRLKEYPKDEGHVSDHLLERWITWLEISIMEGLLTAGVLSIVGNEGRHFILIMGAFGFFIGLCSVVSFVLSARIFLAHFVAKKMFRPERFDFRSGKRAERAIERFENEGPSKVATWICLPSNFEVYLGLVVGILGALNTPQFLAA